MAKQLIRFDWAIKRLLRHKANFSILEGFLSELLKFDVKIESILEGEGNQETEDDKYNRVDILVRSTEGELMLVEVQNESQADYFQRMIYGASKLVTEYIKQSQPYSSVKKIFAIHIVYFNLGQGTDYIYEYEGRFVGAHNGSILLPTKLQRDRFGAEQVADVFPKYYLLKVNNFDNVAKDTLDEWIYFLKNSEVKDEFKAKGLDEVRERLREDALNETEKAAYRRFQESRRIERSVLQTAMDEGSVKREQEIVLNMHAQGLSVEQIAAFTQLT